MRTAEERMESFFDSWREFVNRISGFRNSLDIIAGGLKTAMSLYQRRAVRDIDGKEDDGEEDEIEKKQLRKRKGRKKFFSSEEEE